ncbi:MAG: VOC family protein [Anaerolineales bacterium]|nr:VOC family protein [Anaerolineales bacterium]
MLANVPVFATLPSVDLAAAREFYTQTLGLTEQQIFEVEGPGPIAALFQGGAGTSLLVYQRPTPTRADHTAASWIVNDLDVVADALITEGVRLLVYPEMEGVEWDERGVATSAGNRSIWFNDPDGNILSVAEMP